MWLKDYYKILKQLPFSGLWLCSCNFEYKERPYNEQGVKKFFFNMLHISLNNFKIWYWLRFSKI